MDPVTKRRIDRNIDTLEASPLANRCVVCGHIKHNELAYCQVGQCPCSTGVTLASMARILRRDIA